MGHITTHSTLPMCAGGIPFFCLACGQLGWQVLGGSSAADLVGAGVVGCEGHHAGYEEYGKPGSRPNSLGPTPWAQCCDLEAVALQERRLLYHHHRLEWSEVHTRGHYAHLGIYPPLCGPASGCIIRPGSRGSNTGGVVHTSPPPTNRVTTTWQHLPGNWPSGQHSKHRPTTKIWE